MAHVQIKAPNPEHGDGQVIVDGIDISNAVIASSLSVRFEPFTLGGPCRAIVSIDLAAHVLDVDLPDAVVEAARVTEDDYIHGVNIILPRDGEEQS